MFNQATALGYARGIFFALILLFAVACDQISKSNWLPLQASSEDDRADFRLRGEDIDWNKIKLDLNKEKAIRETWSKE